VKLLVDMNLTPEWVGFLARHGFHAQHWSSVGKAKATDQAILQFAVDNEFVVFTHDLDFGNILAASQARSPSVVQVRTQDPTPEAIGEMVLTVLRQQRSELERGALITVEPQRMRVRVLPLWQGAG
jgi:predicted nuclease of predicted toxin-antitoxin system